MRGRSRNSQNRRVDDLLRASAQNAAASTATLQRLLERWPETSPLTERLSALEHDGDEITHAIVALAHSGRFSGSERADLVELATAIDDIVDLAEETAAMMNLYGIEAPMEQSLQLGRVLNAATVAVAAAVATLPTMTELKQHVETIHRHENEGDRLSRAAVASLFVDGIDPMIVIRWKDIYDRLENAIDACEHVADLLTGLSLKAS